MKPTRVSDTPCAFIGKLGTLYIRVPKVQPEPGNKYTNQTAVYPSVNAYNTRTAIPDYVELNTVIDDYDKAVEIDMQALTIKNQEPQQDEMIS